MKFGFRTPSIKSSFKARTTSKYKRKIKQTTNSLYGKRGIGIINNPKKAFYNSIYSKTSIGISNFLKTDSAVTHLTNKDKQVMYIDKAQYNKVIAAIIHYCEFGGKPIGPTNDSYPRWFIYRFNIDEPIKYHIEAIYSGYLIEAPSIVSLKRQNMDQLKNILISNNLPIKGKKNDLIQRILNELDVSKLDIERIYIPSEKGWKHLEKYKNLFE